MAKFKNRCHSFVPFGNAIQKSHEFNDCNINSRQSANKSVLYVSFDFVFLMCNKVQASDTYLRDLPNH